MKFAISNLAWRYDEERRSLSLLRRKGIVGVEIAPTLVWPEWKGLNITTARRYASYLEDLGFEIPCLQSIFFGKNFGSIFDERNHNNILCHLDFVADIAAALCAKTVVFGSPRVRQFIDGPMDHAPDIAVPFLQKATEHFHNRDINLCLEPCSREYKCDFINTHSELLQLIEIVDRPRFGLHIDAGNLHETGEMLSNILAYGRPVCHFHISEPGLTGFKASLAPHLENLTILRECLYQGWVSIEMLRSDGKLSSALPLHLIDST